MGLSEATEKLKIDGKDRRTVYFTPSSSTSNEGAQMPICAKTSSPFGNNQKGTVEQLVATVAYREHTTDKRLL